MVGFTTQILHSDRASPIEHGSVHKPIHGTVAYGYDDAHDLAAVFQGTQKGFTYGRQVNPTLSALETKLSKMENGIDTAVFSTGMAAIGTLLFALLRNGDHFVSSTFLFGNTNSLFNSFEVHGIDVSFVDATDVEQVRSAINEKTKLVFVETIANPCTQVAALDEIGKLCEERGLIYVVDNTLTSPYLYQPRVSKADLVVNSLTKYIGGHANALGGAITDTGHFAWDQFDNIYDTYKSSDSSKWGITQIRKKGIRDFGATLDPAAANRLAIGAETLALRMERQCLNAWSLAQWLKDHPKVKRVYYPGLHDHPEHNRAAKLFKHFGALFSFVLNDDVDVFDCMNRMQVVIKSSNLGDNRTLAIPVAHTIYYEMGPERRASMGIEDTMVRISVGIEDTNDLIDDFDRALAA